MRKAIVAVVLLALVATPAAYALLAQYHVRTSRFYEQTPAAAVDGTVNYLAWTQNTRAHPRRNDAFLKRGTATKVKLNAAGHGYLGGIDPPLVVYQQVLRGQSNLKLYDAVARTRSDPPPGVNTSDWEWSPSISGDWLLYSRVDVESTTEWVFLRSLTIATEVELDQGVGFHEAGQVNGDYAVWTSCAATCDVVRRQISTSTDATLSKPTVTTYQYGAAVTSKGVVYLARSGKACGSNVKIVRYFGTGDPALGTVVASLGSGRDLQSAHARENADGSVDVFYDRTNCASRSDIYRVRDPAQGP